MKTLRILPLVVCSAMASAHTIPFTFSATRVGGLFAFTFTDASNHLQVTGLETTLGNGLMYDLETGAPGYLIGTPLTLVDLGVGATLSGGVTSGPLGDRVATFTFTSFGPGETFSYLTDIDDNVVCPGGFAGTLCAIGAELVTPAEFLSRGALGISFVLAPLNPTHSITPAAFSIAPGAWSQTALGNTAALNGTLVLAPEPGAALLLGAGLAALGLVRRIRCGRR